MQAFCKNYEAYYGKHKGNVGEISNFYLFTEVEKFEGTEGWPKPKRSDYGPGDWGTEDYIQDLDDWQTDHQAKYGSKFARFIKKEKLGKVVTLPKKPNSLNHPDHIVQMWLWSPDVEALRKWYAKNKDKDFGLSKDRDSSYDRGGW